MEIILRQAVENLGKPGDVVTVKNGYARNFLLPRGFAYEATPGNLKRIAQERDRLEAAENDGTVMAGPRYAKIYQIHKTRCIFCGMCEEACPVSAIFMGKDYELAVYSKDDFVWDKSDLLVAPQPNAQLPAAAGQR